MIDRKLLKMIMQTELSDLIFKQHMKSYMPLNIFIISIQLIMMLLAIIIDVNSDLHFSRYSCVVNLILCVIVIANNVIHSYTWKKSKERAELIYSGINILENKEESIELQKEFINVAKTICPSLYFSEDSNKN